MFLLKKIIIIDIKPFFREDFKAFASESGCPSDSDSDSSGAKTVLDALVLNTYFKFLRRWMASTSTLSK